MNPDYTHLEDIELFRAIQELDEELDAIDAPHMDLKVVGGFAMLLNNLRPHSKSNTDVDYVGPDLTEQILAIEEKVGARHNFESHWINNDVIMSGMTLEQFEMCTGKLNFILKASLKRIDLYSLDEEGLIRMKLIALDTSYLGATACGGQFTRAKDLEDIRLLMENQKMTLRDLQKIGHPYVTCPNIYYVIRYYLKTRDINITNRDTLLKIVNNQKNEARAAHDKSKALEFLIRKLEEDVDGTDGRKN